MPLLMLLLTVGVVGLAMYLASSAAGLSIMLYVDAASAIIVLVPTFCLTIASYSVSDLMNAFSNSFSDVKDIKLIKNSISLLEQMKNTCIMFGWIGAMISWFIIAFSMDYGGDSESNILAHFGAAFGVSLYAIFYGYLFSYLIFEPMKNQYIKKQNNLEF